MKQDEFAFFNQQMASMLREGIPLEGALKQLSIGMRRGVLRRELELLEQDLAHGIPLNTALSNRKLPELYVRMVQAGVQSNDLPGVLSMLADHYQRTYSVWTRLKGLMIYPLIVLLAAFSLSILLAATYTPFSQGMYEALYDTNLVSPSMLPDVLSTYVWILLPSCLLGTLLFGLVATSTIPALRRRALWILPAFKEANLARFASFMELSLKGGSDLGEAFATARVLEGDSPLGRELRSWEQHLAKGCKRLRDVSGQSRLVPPLFVWLVDSCGEDWAQGFRQARQIYSARAIGRSEMFLYAALPVSIVALAILIVAQLIPMLRLLTLGLSWL